MAGPVPLDVTQTEEASNTTTSNYNWPATIAAGDGLLLLCAWDGSPTSITGITGAGFTALTAPSSLRGCTYAAYYRAASGSETGTFTVTWSGSQQMEAAIVRFDAADVDFSTTPPVTTTVSSGSTSPADPPAITPAAGADDYTYIAGWVVDARWPNSVPTGYTSLFQDTSVGVQGVSMDFGYLSTTNTTTENPAGSGTFSPDDGWQGFTIAVVAPAGALEITPAAVTVTASPGTLSITTGAVDVTPQATTVTATPGSMTVAPGTVDIAPQATTVTTNSGTLTITTGAVDVVPAATIVTATPGTLSVAATGGTQDITPAATTITTTAGSLTVTTGAVDITPDPTTVTVTPSSVSVTQGFVVTPAAVTVTSTPGSVTITTGAVNVTPQTTTITATPGTAVVTQGLSVAPAAVTVTATPNSLTVTTGTVNVTPDPVTVSVSPGAVSVGSGVTLTAPSIVVTPGTVALDLFIVPAAVTVTASGTVTVVGGSQPDWVYFEANVDGTTDLETEDSNVEHLAVTVANAAAFSTVAEPTTGTMSSVGGTIGTEHQRQGG